MTTTESNQSTITVNTVTTNNIPVVTINLTPQQQNRVKELTSQKSLSTMQSNEIALYGSERQVAFSKSLDGLLSQITKGSSPVLFQLFKELRTAGGKADMGKLETDIRTSLEKSWFQSLLETCHLSNAADYVEKVNRRIGSALVSKTASLLDVMHTMEDKVNVEMQQLITDSGKLDILAKEFINNGEEFGVTVTASRSILEDGRSQLADMESKAQGDMMAVQRAKDFRQKVELFESRSLILENAYVKSFANLDAVGLAKAASITTIAETANSVLSEFTDIKTSLVVLSVAYKNQSVQALNAARRQVRAKLEQHCTTVLSQVAITAAKMQGDNRLEDAQLLATMVNNLKQIGSAVEIEHKNNQQKFAEARTKLVEAQKTLSDITAKPLIS